MTCLERHGNRRFFHPPAGAWSQNSRVCILNRITTKLLPCWRDRSLFAMWCHALAPFSAMLRWAKRDGLKHCAIEAALFVWHWGWGKAVKSPSPWAVFWGGSLCLEHKQEWHVVERFYLLGRFLIRYVFPGLGFWKKVFRICTSEVTLQFSEVYSIQECLI